MWHPWASDAHYTNPITPTVAEHDIGQGEDVAIAVEVATTITTDVQGFLQDHRVPVGRLVVLVSPGGPRDNAVSGSERACALAVGLRDAARRAAHSHSRVHLFLTTPMGLALLLGHRWNRVAPTIVYEDLAALGYEAALP